MSTTANQTGQRVLLDPTSERNLAIRQLAPRLSKIEGATIGLLDISKPRGDLFLNRIEQRIKEAGGQVIRFAKPTFAKAAPADLRQEIATQCDAVIEALAD
jgi:hypothetical protein